MAATIPHMANAAQGPLSRLRDIHTPTPVSAWPPAPGWFLLAAVLAIAICALGWWLYRRWKDNRYRREAMAELHALLTAYREAHDPAAYLRSYAALLKRTALTRYPRSAVAHLTGEAWVDFLDKSANTEEFSMGAGQVLIDANYRPAGANADIDVPALHDLGEQWIKRHKVIAMEKAA